MRVLPPGGGSAVTAVSAAVQDGSKHTLTTGATVVITGAAGYVGGWLVTYCLERGYTVRACVRNVDDDAKVTTSPLARAFMPSKLLPCLRLPHMYHHTQERV